MSKKVVETPNEHANKTFKADSIVLICYTRLTFPDGKTSKIL